MAELPAKRRLEDPAKKSVAQISKGVAALIVAIVFDWKIVIAAIAVVPREDEC